MNLRLVLIATPLFFICNSLHAETEDKLISDLGQAVQYLRQGDLAKNFNVLEKSPNPSNEVLLETKNLILAESLLAQGKATDAIEILESIVDDKKAKFRSQAAALLLRSMLMDGQKTEARELLLKNKKMLLNSHETLTQLDEETCRDERIFPLRDRMKLAKRLLRDMGSRTDLRALGLKIARIDTSAVVPTKKIIELSLTEKEHLLEVSDLLVSSWEYTPALQLLEYLRSSKKFGGKFKQVDVLLLLGRALNQQERFEEARTIYQQLLSMNLTGKQKRNARERYLMSLHFARQYTEEANTIKKWLNKRSRPNELWGLFWAEYLANNFDAANKTAGIIEKKIGKRTQYAALANTLRYWKARILEKQNNVGDAVIALNSIKDSHAESYYSVLARWRLAVINETEIPSNDSLNTLHFFPYFETKSLQKNEVDTIETILKLNNAGLYAYAVPLSSNIRFPARRKADSINSAQKALAIGKYRRAVTLVDDFGQNRMKNGVSADDLEKWMKDDAKFWQAWYPLPYSKEIRSASEKFEVPESLLWGVARKESVFDTTATSAVGALGLMQIMPRTAFRIASMINDTKFSPVQLLQPEVSINYGAWYLRRLLDYYNGSEFLALAAYNAGPAAVDRWIRQNPDLEIDEFVEDIPYDQTRDYIPKIVRYREYFHRFYNKKPLEISEDAGLPTPNKSLEIF